MASTSQAALLSVQGKGATKNSSPEQPAWKSLTELDMNITGRSLQARCTYECIRMYTHAHTCTHRQVHKHTQNLYTHQHHTNTHMETAYASNSTAKYAVSNAHAYNTLPHSTQFIHGQVCTYSLLIELPSL